MKAVINKIFFLLVFASFFIPGLASAEKSSICIHYFVKDDCEQCNRLLPFLEGISQKYGVDLETYNVSQGKANQELYQKLQDFYHLSFSGFPIVFLGDSYLLGEGTIKQNLETIILRCRERGCLCPVEQIKSALTQLPQSGTFSPEKKESISVELFGRKINLSSESSLFFLGILLGIINGINPCMLSVLLFLLTYLLVGGSRKVAVKAGLVFALTVFIVHFFFMIGLLNLIALVVFIKKIKIIVALIALIMGLIMLKDFFFYGKWVSLNIPESAKPTIKKLVEKGTVPSAILLALFASLVQLPCTSGIPLAYVTLLAQKQGPQLFYLFWYSLFFVVPLILITAIFALAWNQAEKMEKWRLAFRKYARLLSALLLIFLAVALLLNWI